MFLPLVAGNYLAVQIILGWLGLEAPLGAPVPPCPTKASVSRVPSPPERRLQIMTRSELCHLEKITWGGK